MRARLAVLGCVMWSVAVSGLAYGASPGGAPAGLQAQAAPALPGSSGGNSIDAIARELKRQYVAGGSTMHFISALSVLGVAFVLERLFRLRRGSVVPGGFMERADALWKAGDIRGVEALAQSHGRSVLGKIILFVARHRSHSVDQLNSIASDIASREMARHRMYLFPLALVAVLSPLLGLFGTVIGMIESFETVAVAGTMGDPSLLSSSISKALITTAYGLVVAMPILFCHHMIKLRTSYLANVLDEQASTLINEWFLRREPVSLEAAR